MRTKYAGATILAVAGILAAPASAADVRNEFGGAFGNRYAQATITVQPGDTVTFSGDFAAHPIKSARSDLPFGKSGGSGLEEFVEPYDKVGVFRYYCEVHGKEVGNNAVSGMSGQVIVGDPKTLKPAVIKATSRSVRFKGRTAIVKFNTDTAGELGVGVRLQNSKGLPSGKDLAKGKRSYDSAGNGNVRLTLTKAGTRKLTAGMTAKVVLTVRYDDIDGRPSTTAIKAKARR